MGIKGAPNGKGIEKTILISYTILNHASNSVKVHTTAVVNMRSNSKLRTGHTRLSHGHMMSRNNQHAEMQHVETRN